MKHEPCSLLHDSDSAVNFQTAHTVLAIDHHPKAVIHLTSVIGDPQTPFRRVRSGLNGAPSVVFQK
jgi:hypothetical protein